MLSSEFNLWKYLRDYFKGSRGRALSFQLEAEEFFSGEDWSKDVRGGVRYKEDVLSKRYEDKILISSIRDGLRNGLEVFLDNEGEEGVLDLMIDHGSIRLFNIGGYINKVLDIVGSVIGFKEYKYNKGRLYEYDCYRMVAVRLGDELYYMKELNDLNVVNKDLELLSRTKKVIYVGNNVFLRVSDYDLVGAIELLGDKYSYGVIKLKVPLYKIDVLDSVDKFWDGCSDRVRSSCARNRLNQAGWLYMEIRFNGNDKEVVFDSEISEYKINNIINKYRLNEEERDKVKEYNLIKELKEDDEMLEGLKILAKELEVEDLYDVEDNLEDDEYNSLFIVRDLFNVGLEYDLLRCFILL